MVYARTVGDRTIHLGVSGWLWNRSLVMQDDETDTMWSHILGEAMSGPLKGSKLTPIPSDMTTWKDWLARHPDTTVLNLPRTAKSYTRKSYRSPKSFVVGWSVATRTYHASFATLLKRPVLNAEHERLLVFDKASTSARLYSRRVTGHLLAFEAAGNGRLRDTETGSLWDRATGVAVAGEMKGRRLAHAVAIVSYARTWKTFHPDSTAVKR